MSVRRAASLDAIDYQTYQSNLSDLTVSTLRRIDTVNTRDSVGYQLSSMSID